MYSMIFRRKWVALGWAAMTIGSAYMFIPREGEKGPVDTALNQIKAQQEARRLTFGPTPAESPASGWGEEPQLRDAPPEPARPKTAVVAEASADGEQADPPVEVEIVDRRATINGVPAPDQ